MRISKLNLIRYGRFEDCDLVFPPAETDLQLILGPNEAGKSTTLEALGDLLFGFPGRTRFAFRFDQPLLRVGATLERDGQTLEVVRRKGNANTLLAPDGQPADGAALAAFLGGQSRESFERMFGLDHTRLRRGGKAILDAKDDVGAAIFAAGSGLVHAARICEALEDEAKAIWTKGAGESRKYTAAAAAYQRAKTSLREVEVRPTAWVRAKKELEGVEAELVRLREARAGVIQAQRRVQRKQLLLAPSARRAEALKRLADLADAPALSPAAVKQCDEALSLAQRTRATLDAANEDLKRLQTEAEALRAPEDRLAAAAALENLQELKGVVDKGEAELADLEARRLAAWNHIKTALGEIGWTEEDVSALKARIPSRAIIGEVRNLLTRQAGVEERVRTAQEANREAEAAKARLEAETRKLPVPPDVRPLQDALREITAAGLSQAVGQCERTLAELEAVLASRLRLLTPWSGDIEALRAAAAPSDAEVDQAVAALNDAAQALSAAEESLTQAVERLETAELRRDQAARAHPVAGEAALHDARQARMAAWSPLRSHVVEGAPLKDPASAVGLFEEAVEEADRIADERFAAAEHAGGLVALDGEIQRADLERRQGERRRTTAQARLETAQSQFQALVSKLGIAFTPDAYLEWRDTRAEALDAASAAAEAKRDLERAQNAETAARETLSALLGRTEVSSLRELISAAEATLADAAEARSLESGVRARLEAAQQAAQRADDQLKTSLDAQTLWKAAWDEAKPKCGLDAGVSVGAAGALIDLMEALRADVQAMADLDLRLEAIRRNAAEFGEKVREAVKAAGVEAEGDPSQVFAALSIAVKDAVAQAERARQVEQAREQAQTRVRDTEAALAQIQAALEPLGAPADATPPDLRNLLNRATESARLRSAVDELDDEILGHGDGRPLEEVLGEVTESDAEALAAESADLADALERLDALMGEAREARQAADRAFKDLDKDLPDAAIAAFEMEEARSEMVFQAEAYVRKRAEARLLRSAIDRYREEKQGPLLTRASSLFATLTLGAFSGLIVDYEGDTPVLAGVRPDRASVVAVEGMSEGTMDQLFLALRLAAVEAAVDEGVRLPFVADDLFINFDDERSAAGFKVLADLARKTQVLFFTHHAHLADVAEAAIRPAKVSVCGLDRDSALSPESSVTAA